MCTINGKMLVRAWHQHQQSAAAAAPQQPTAAAKVERTGGDGGGSDGPLRSLCVAFACASLLPAIKNTSYNVRQCKGQI